MTRSDAPRLALLDAAERHFALHGLSGASDRQIAEGAGHRNHSAVAYYFGGRDGLLTALLERHSTSVDAGRRTYFDASTSLLDDVRSLVLPFTDVLAALPAPTWRARFLARALSHQSTIELVRAGLRFTPTALEVDASIRRRLQPLAPSIVAGRLSLLPRTVVLACADVERTAQDGEVPPWRSVGYFLADAMTGMLGAPASAVGVYPDVDGVAEVVGLQESAPDALGDRA